MSLAEIIRVAVAPVLWSFEKLAAMQHEGSWGDVATKAKRLVASGQVTILRNSPNHIMAHVIGDHGEYDCEISRHDPNSSIIEQWNCECPWAQYAFDRTRKWKHLEGRVCSHVLAAYWKAKQTPIDTEGMEEGFQAPPGQVPGQAPGQQKMPMEITPIPGLGPETPAEAPVTPPTPLPAPTGPPVPPVPPVAPTTPPTTPLVTGPAPTTPVVPPSPVSVPGKQPQHTQLQLFDITRPIGQQPLPAATPVSVPGKTPPTPGSPVVFPGTFSHFLPIIRVHSSEFIYAAAEPVEQYIQEGGHYVALSKEVTLELTGGKIPMPGAQPYDTSAEGVPLYRVVDLGYNPATGRREDASENEVSGAPEQTGTYATFRPGTRAQVLDWDPNLKMVYIFAPIHYQGQDVRLHPHGAKGWVDYDEIRPSVRGGDPFRRGR